MASQVIVIALSEAYLCECGTVGNSPTVCPKCANRLGLFNLARVLDRPEERTASERISAMIESLDEVLQ